MKIVLIHGQNHKGSTYHTGRILADYISGGNDIKEFFLPRSLNHFCGGCYQCIEDEGKCPFYNEKRIVMQEVEKADLLIFTTPNYCMAPSAPMKAFMDLTFIYWMSHRPRECMFKKRAAVISTTAGAGAGKAIGPVARMLTYWGVPEVKKYGVAVQAKCWDDVSAKKKEKIYKDMKKLAKKLSREKLPKVPVKTKLLFNMMALMQRGNMGSGSEEKRYWEELGWLGKERPWKRK